MLVSEMMVGRDPSVFSSSAYINVRHTVRYLSFEKNKHKHVFDFVPTISEKDGSLYESGIAGVVWVSEVCPCVGCGFGD